MFDLTPIQKLQSTYQSACKYADKQGNRERRADIHDLSIGHAASFLLRKNLIIDWSGSKECLFGYESIWEYCAGEYFGSNLRPAQKAQEASRHAIEMKNGFSRLKERMLEEWGSVLLTVPRRFDQQQIVIITLDKDYVVNNEGQTAYEVQRMRDEKIVHSHIKSSFMRSSLIIGKDETRNSIARILYQITEQPASIPCGNPISRHQLALIDCH